MQISERYDVICVGGTFSSYLAAAILSTAGCRVLVIDPQEGCVPHDVDGRTIFDPDLTPIWGLEFDSSLSRTLSNLGILGTPDALPYVSLGGLSQVLNPAHRVKLSFDSNKLLQELKLEIPDSHGVLTELFEKLVQAAHEIPRYSSLVQNPAQMASQELAKTLKFWGVYGAAALGKDQALHDLLGKKSSIANAFLSGLIATLGPVSSKNVGTEQVLRTLSVAIRGQAFWRGGVESLKATLRRVAVQNGTHLVLRAQVDGLLYEKDRVRGVQLSSYDGVVFADYTILTTHLRKTYQTLPSVVADPTVMRSLNRVVPSHWRYTIAVSLNRDVIPVGATELMSYIGSYKLELEEENLLRIVVVPEGVYVDADTPDTVTVHVTALVPYRVSSLDYGYLRRLGGKMLHALAEIIPFFEYNVVSMYPDIRKDDRDLRALYPFDRREWVSEDLLSYYVRGGQECQAFAGVSWATPHENLYFAGRAALPSLGVFGEAVVTEKIVKDLLSPVRWKAPPEPTVLKESSL
ncbi:MAG TPA: hypothetical protein PLH57_03380 [Oligoflexia bacterium]|nr:hypothetical protein [Oligoflexia bacterium]